MIMEAIRLLKRRPWGIAGVLILLAVIMTAILAPVFAPCQPNQISMTHRLQPPGGDFILGTDNLGRDVFTRLLYGSRPYVVVGLTTTAMAIVLGLLVGFISASVKGKVDSVLRRALLVPPLLLGIAAALFILDWLLPLPGVFSALVLTFPAILGPPWFIAIYVPLLLSFVFLPSVYGVVRSACLSAASGRKLGVGSSKNLSAFSFRILSKELAPLIPLILVNLGMAVLVITPLSFLGFGVPPPTPEWGSALSGTRRSSLQSAPWIARYPVIAIVVTFAGTILFGQAVHEIWFPRIASPLLAGSDKESSSPSQTSRKAS